MTMDEASDVYSRFYSSYMSYSWKVCGVQQYAGNIEFLMLDKNKIYNGACTYM